MKREAMAGILDDFIAHVTKIHADERAETTAKLRKAERCLYGTLALAACSLVATVVMAVTR